MSTPHIHGQRGDFAETVLMPGDPLRAKYIAETFLSQVQLVTEVRNMLGFTGLYQGQPISVMSHGMGIPSMSIYAKELITDFGVKTLIRVGSCGAVRDDVALQDLVIGLGASTDSKVNRTRLMDHDFAAIADFELVSQAVAAANAAQIPVKVGQLFTADLFYSEQPELFALLKKYGVLGMEMEAAGLYGVATEYGARAVTLCTVSDHILRQQALSTKERETSFNDMIAVALATAIAY